MKRTKLSLKTLTAVLIIISACICILPNTSRADIVTLKNRNTLEGKITQETDEYIWIEFGGGGFQIWKNEITSIEKKEYIPPPPPVHENEDSPKVPMAIAIGLILVAAVGGFFFFFKRKPKEDEDSEEDEQSVPEPKYDPYAEYQQPKFEPPTPKIDYDGVFNREFDDDPFATFEEKSAAEKDPFDEQPPSQEKKDKDIDETPHRENALDASSKASVSGAPEQEEEKGAPAEIKNRRINRPFIVNLVIAAQILTALSLLGILMVLCTPISLGAFQAIPSSAVGSLCFTIIFIVIVFCLVPAFGLFFMRSWARYMMIGLLTVLAMTKVMYIATDFDPAAYLFKLSTSSKATFSIEKPVQSINRIFNRSAVPHRNHREQESKNWQESAPTKTIMGFLLLLEFLLLYYFFQKEQVLEAFAESEIIPLKKALNIKKILITVIALLVLSILLERLYTMVLWKKYNIPDHLKNHVITVAAPLTSSYEMLKGYDAEKVFGFMVHVPEYMQRDDDVIMYAHFRNKNAGTTASLSIRLIKGIDYANMVASVKSRWNPIYIPLRNRATADGIRKQGRLVHGRHWSGFYEEIYSTEKKTLHAVVSSDNNKLFLDIILQGKPEEIDEETFKTILGSLELPI